MLLTDDQLADIIDGAPITLTDVACICRDAKTKSVRDAAYAYIMAIDNLLGALDEIDIELG